MLHIAITYAVNKDFTYLKFEVKAFWISDADCSRLK